MVDWISRRVRVHLENRVDGGGGGALRYSGVHMREHRFQRYPLNKF